MMRTFSLAIPAVLAIAGAANADAIYATNVEYFAQGLTNGGGAVLPERSDPLQALGAPQDDDTENFVSLGFGGALVLSFGQQFGGEITVWETTYGNPASYPEAAEILVGVGASWDTADWYSCGVLQNFEDGAPMSLDDANLASGQTAYDFLMIVDMTDPQLHGAAADGFDVDGVSAMTVPAPGVLTLLGVGLAGGRTRRRRG